MGPGSVYGPRVSGIPRIGAHIEPNGTLRREGDGAVIARQRGHLDQHPKVLAGILMFIAEYERELNRRSLWQA